MEWDGGRTRDLLHAVMAQDSDEPLSARLTRAAPAIVGVDGSALCLVRDDQLRLVVAVSDPSTAELEQIQLDLGAGPCVVAARQRTQVLVPDVVDSADPALWIYLRQLAATTDVRAVFSFPVAMGAMVIGALDLFNRRAGPLRPPQLSAAVMLCDLVALALLAEQAGAAVDDDDLAWLAEPPDVRMLAHQATGIVMVQLDLGVEPAFALLRAHAFASNLSLTEVARRVVDHTLFLEN